MKTQPKSSKQATKPKLKAASISKHAKVLGKLGGRPTNSNKDINGYPIHN